MRVLFIGTGEIGVPSLRALLESDQWQLVGLVTQPDKPAGRSQEMRAPAPKTLLRQASRNLPILQPARIKAPDALDQIKALEPDVIVVAAYGQILPRTLLKTPRLACINLHASLLPRWRGAAPIQAAIAAGDFETGMTIMYVDEGLDTGDIMLSRKLAITSNETGGSLHNRLAAIAPDALLEALDLIQKSKAPRMKQDESLATYAPKLTREAGQIDWNEPSEVIERKIRAFNPWPGAFTPIRLVDGAVRNLKVFSASLADHSGAAGTLIAPPLVIACGTKALSLNEVQLEGRKRMSTVEFLRGVAVRSVG